MELRLRKLNLPFDLESTLECGQLFRFEKRGDWWFGVTSKSAFKVRQNNGVLDFEGVTPEFLKDYFRLEDDLTKIVSEISRDEAITQAIHDAKGLRIARQDPWECLISFMCATYKNIPSIKRMISELARSFGERISLSNHVFHTFPKPKALADSHIRKLRRCGLGFRAERIRQTARIILQEELDLAALKRADYETAKTELLQLPGVGNKVADCVLLFSLEKLEAFPVDTWMRRVITEFYAQCFDHGFIERISKKNSLSPRESDKIGLFARDYFGRFAGYAQQYLFHYARKRFRVPV